MLDESESFPDSAAGRIHQRSLYVVLVWAEDSQEAEPTWRGFIETPARLRVYFKKLAELDYWLKQWSGWMDPPEISPADES